jgi:hypothetical protein
MCYAWRHTLINKLERNVKNEVKKILKSYGVMWFMPQAGAFGKSGIADFVCCCNGNYLEIETKSETGRQSKLQKKHNDDVLSAGGDYLIVRNQSDLVALMIQLESYGCIGEIQIMTLTDN